MIKFPNTRMRRLRTNRNMRKLMQRHSLSAKDFIYPIFITQGKTEDTALPYIKRLSLEDMLSVCEQAHQVGILAVALFPHIDPNIKTEDGSEALNEKGLVCQAIGLIKEHFPELLVVCDVALDPYTAHGQDGLVIDNQVDNDATVDILAKQAVLYVQAGADIIAPSDMMDGRVGAIRLALEVARMPHTHIMSYAAKFNSHFYSPFRDAIGSTQKAPIDKSSYQMDGVQSDQAMQEIAMDIQEGADSIIIKPGMPYLDIIYRADDIYNTPIFAYQVSGEYKMLCTLSEGDRDYLNALAIETLMSFKRAGATGIWSYFALDIAPYLK